MTQIQKHNAAGELGTHVIMVSRMLFSDKVPAAAKIILWLAIAYWLWPADLISIAPGLSAIDDITILFVAQAAAVGLTPKKVLQELRK